MKITKITKNKKFNNHSWFIELQSQAECWLSSLEHIVLRGMQFNSKLTLSTASIFCLYFWMRKARTLADEETTALWNTDTYS